MMALEDSTGFYRRPFFVLEVYNYFLFFFFFFFFLGWEVCGFEAPRNF
jgi:hypothetical protein